MKCRSGCTSLMLSCWHGISSVMISQKYPQSEMIYYTDKSFFATKTMRSQENLSHFLKFLMKISRCNGNIILDEFNVDLKWQKIRTIAQSNILESIYTKKSRLGKTKTKSLFPVARTCAFSFVTSNYRILFFYWDFFSKIKIKSPILWKTFEKIWKIFTGKWFLVSIKHMLCFAVWHTLTFLKH